jgi:SnoaL-like domain
MSKLTKPNDATEIAATMSMLLVALLERDQPMALSLVTPNFYCFDAGKRMDANELIQMVHTARTNGTNFAWSLTDPDVRIDSGYAWMAYINVGSIQTSTDAQPTPMRWLESAHLERSAGAWKVAFFHSSRAATGQS